MTGKERVRSKQSGQYRTRSSMETAARVAEKASKRTGRPVSAGVEQLIKDQQRR